MCDPILVTLLKMRPIIVNAVVKMNIQLEKERAPQSQYFQGLRTKRHVMRKMSHREFMASHAAYEGPFSLTPRI